MKREVRDIQFITYTLTADEVRIALLEFCVTQEYAPGRRAMPSENSEIVNVSDGGVEIISRFDTHNGIVQPQMPRCSGSTTDARDCPVHAKDYQTMRAGGDQL